MLEFFRSSAVRVAIAFVFATTVATSGIFALVYLQIKATDQRSNRLILEDEAAKSVNHSVDELKYAFEVRLTHGLRRLDYAALFSADRKAMFGNIDELPKIPVDGKSHFVAASPVPGGDNRREPAIFVARTRPDGTFSCSAEACSKPSPFAGSCWALWPPGSHRCCCWRWRSARSSPDARRGVSPPFTTPSPES